MSRGNRKVPSEAGILKTQRVDGEGMQNTSRSELVGLATGDSERSWSLGGPDQHIEAEMVNLEGK